MTPIDASMDKPPMPVKRPEFSINATFDSESEMRETVDVGELLLNPGHRFEIAKLGISMKRFYGLKKPASKYADATTVVYGSIDQSALKNFSLADPKNAEEVIYLLTQELGNSTWKGNMKIVLRDERLGKDATKAIAAARETFEYDKKQAQAADLLFSSPEGKRLTEVVPREYRDRAEMYISSILGPKDKNGVRPNPTYEEKIAEVKVE